MQAPRFRWFILISLGIHTVFLWLFPFVPRHEPKSFPPLEVGLFKTPSSPQRETSTQDGSRQATARTVPLQSSARTTPLTPGVRSEDLSSTRDYSASPEGTITAPGGPPSGTGVIAPESQGTSGGGGPSTGTRGTSPGTGESSTGSKGAAPGRKDPSPAEIPAAAVRAAGFQSSFDDGAIHPEVDHYTLDGINIPGPDVCIEGDQIRTKERLTFTRTITDLSRCRVIDLGGDTEKVVCPPQADTKLVTFEGYPSSPVAYSVKVCLLYDKSNCYMRDLGDGMEREVCRVDFKYDGTWAEGTIFEYRCLKSEIHTYRHPLEYNIRYFSEREIDNRLRRREVYRETRSVLPCN